MFGVTVVKNSHAACGVEKQSKSMLVAPPRLVIIHVREFAIHQKYHRFSSEKVSIPCATSGGDGVYHLK